MRSPAWDCKLRRDVVSLRLPTDFIVSRLSRPGNEYGLLLRVLLERNNTSLQSVLLQVETLVGVLVFLTK